MCETFLMLIRLQLSEKVSHMADPGDSVSPEQLESVAA